MTTLRDKNGKPITVGTRLSFSHDHLLQTVRFTARVVQLDGEYVWVEVPERLRNLPFPPKGGKRYLKFLASMCLVASIKAV